MAPGNASIDGEPSGDTSTPRSSAVESPSLGDVLAGLLDETSDVSTPTDREYARGSVTFAARPAEDVIELRLGEEIAEAAMRTPDTAASNRGPDWVRFAPSEWDEHSFDRLESWFLVAWRLADKRR